MLAGVALIACGNEALDTAGPSELDSSFGTGSTSAGGSAGKGGADAGADAATGGALGVPDAEAGVEAAVDHSDLLPAGVEPPVLWFWRGIQQANLGNWHTDAQGRLCADGDTTMWFISPGNNVDGCKGAPACDPDHFGTPAAPCTGVDCSWRNWDDPRGPEFRVSNATGPVEIHNQNAKGTGGKVPDLGFGVRLCAAPGTTASIDTCPRPDVYSCVETNYPQLVDACTTVLLTVATPPSKFPASLAGCYSTKADVTISF